MLSFRNCKSKQGAGSPHGNPPPPSGGCDVNRPQLPRPLPPLSGGLVCGTLVRASHLCHYQLNSEISVVGREINCSLTPAISLWRRGDNYPPLWSLWALPDIQLQPREHQLPNLSAVVFNGPRDPLHQTQLGDSQCQWQMGF